MSPDSRHHRGPHPEDPQLFGVSHLPSLRHAVADLSWLMTRGYAMTSAVKLVGDRHGLDERQRVALARASCSDQSLARRRSTCVAARALAGERVLVDGLNLLITVEAALGGALIMLCRDGCMRDLASVHGTYRSVDETAEALSLAGKALESLAPAHVHWLFDQPVSNSGRLVERVRSAAAAHGWPWTAETALSPDPMLAASPDVAVTTDAPVLDRVSRWANLAAHIISAHVPRAWIVPLDTDPRVHAAGG